MSDDHAGSSPPVEEPAAAQKPADTTLYSDSKGSYVKLGLDQRVYALIGSLSEDEIRKLKTDELHFRMFSALPTEVTNWHTMSKTSLKKAMADVQWAKLRQEKDRRKLARGGDAVVGSKRKREDDVSPAETNGRITKRGRWLDDACQGVRVVVDCSFEDLMTMAERRSMSVQLGYCYSANKKGRKPLRLIFTSLDDLHITTLKHQMGFDRWPLDIFKEHFTEVFATTGTVNVSDVRTAPSSKSVMPEVLCSPGLSNLVYLTADSDNVIHELNPEHVYIVGGLVDRNRHKGITAKRAAEAGIKTARLPIDEFVDMKATQVLTTNHVVEILIHFSEHKNWKDALLSVLPDRKGAQEVSETSAAAAKHSAEKVEEDVSAT